MKFGSLFSGIGGIDLGLERAGMKCVWQSEVDEFANKVLAKHWPDVSNLGDVTQIDWSEVENVDLICGGYPCQGFSYAGFRSGIDDERYLWPAMRDCICELRPRYVLIENVAGHLSLGFDITLADLAELGYDAEWSLVSACSMGAPHPRQRLFCVAHASDFRRQWRWSNSAAQGPAQLETRQPQGFRALSPWVQIPAPQPFGVANGIPDRMDRLRGLGNAVVPEVAEWVGRQILTLDS